MVEIPSTGTRKPIPKGNGIGEVRTAFTGKASLAMISRPDFYLTNPPSQPKAEIADYVEKNGILVPRRFKTLKEALASGKNFIIRSEHLEELNGASGLLDSFKFDVNFLKESNEASINGIKQIKTKYQNGLLLYSPTDIGILSMDIKEFKKYFQEFFSQQLLLNYIYYNAEKLDEEDLKELLVLSSYRRIKIYCGLLGKNINDFIKGISFSYWELLGGYNRSIVADSAIKGRYHIFTNNNYKVWDKGIMLINGVPEYSNSRLDDEFLAGIGDVIDFYEKIRRLKNFNGNHCPIVEFQTFEGQNYFLQYHRTRDFEEADFILNRQLEEGEIEAEFVRGITPEEGIEIDITIYPGENQYDINDLNGRAIKTNNIAFEELIYKKIPLSLSYNGLKKLLASACGGHMFKSSIFKPGIKLVLHENILTDAWINLYYEYSRETGKKSTMRIRVISDGRKAYVKILGNNLGES